MKVNTQIIEAYFAGEDLLDFKNHWIYNGVGQGELKNKNIFRVPDTNNPENIKIIYNEIKRCLGNFEPFNKSLWDILFKDWKSVLEEVEVYLIIGLPEPNDATVIKTPKGTNAIILDLGCFEKYLGHIEVNELVRNIVTHECCHICIQEYNPKLDEDYEKGSYLEKLNSLIFNEGLAHLLSFCENIDSYDWNSEKISKARAINLSKLKESVIEKEESNQNSYLYNAMFGNYFDKFGSIIGMLYFFDNYKKDKVQGLLRTYIKGYKEISLEILKFYS